MESNRRRLLTALAVGSIALCPVSRRAEALVGADQTFRCIGCGSFKSGAREKLVQWLEMLKTQAKSTSDYFIGRETKETASSLTGWRMLVIVPSEYVRDSSLDWDLFE